MNMIYVNSYAHKTFSKAAPIDFYTVKIMKRKNGFKTCILIQYMMYINMHWHEIINF